MKPLGWEERQNIFHEWITKSRWSSSNILQWLWIFSCISARQTWLCKHKPLLFIMRSVSQLINFMLSSEDYRCLCDFGCFRQRLGFICFKMVARSLSIFVCTWPKIFSPFKSKTSSVCLENRSTQVWANNPHHTPDWSSPGKYKAMMWNSWSSHSVIVYMSGTESV